MKKTTKRTFSILLCLLLALSVCSVAAFAEGETTKEVTYIDASGTPQTVEATVAVPGIYYGASVETGWYVIEGTYSGDGQLFFEDTVTNLILADNADWTITNSGEISIGNVNSAGTLNVYAQANNTGALHLAGGMISYGGAMHIYGGSIVSSYKIGGSPSKGDLTADNCTLTGSLYGKDITLSNCTVTGNTGNCTGAFTLDGGSYTSVCGSYDVPVRAASIVITNATVEGSGGQFGLHATGGSVTIRNSTVTLSASNMAISGSGVSISGGSVTAISTGNFGIYSSGGPIEITGGTVTAEGGVFGLYSGQGVALTGGVVTAAGNVAGVNPGGSLTLGADTPNSSYTLGKVLSGATVTVKDGQTLTDGENDYTGTLTSEQVAALAGKALTCKHAWAWVVDDEPTCGEAGKQHQICTVCGTTQNEGTVIDPTGDHDYADAEWTYYNEEQHVRFCTECGAPEYEGHDVILKGTGDATCGAEGFTGSEYCSVCGTRLSEGEIIPPTGNHTTIIVNAKDATATEDGYTGDEVCTVCGQTVKTGEVIPATGAPDEPTEGACPLCGKTHSAKWVRILHYIFYVILCALKVIK
ncbi:MAG: hypothetical protein IKN72_05630 [Clostridia bacterium]|nr:hypothetical protein [Clostridia bacterium]